jgi:NTE family protein
MHRPHPPRSLLGALALGVLLLAAACTSTTRVLPPAQRIGFEEGYRPEHTNRRPGQEPALPGRYVILTFSGGGTRATALAHGVLREFGATPAEAPGLTLLHAVDMVSSASGGSVAAANFALHGPEGYDQLHTERGFLHHDGMADLAGQLVLNPFNITAFTLTPLSRIEVLPEMFRRQAGFGDATFRDLRAALERKRPFLVLNSADMATGLRFSFTQEQLDRLCLDLRDIRIADAVAASAAFPVALTPLPLPVHSPCRAQEEDRRRHLSIVRGFDLQARISDQRRARREGCDGTPSAVRSVLFERVPGQLPRALRQWHLLNTDICGRPLPWSERVRYVHLVDGGTADNLGLSAPLEAVTGGDIGGPLGRALARGEVREIIVVAVNARSQGDVPRLTSGRTPGILPMVMGAINTPIDGRSAGLLAQLGTLGPLLRDRFRELSGGTTPEVRVFAVDFERIADPECRTAFQGIGTTWALARHEVDALQEMASAMLRTEPRYLALARDGADRATGLARAQAACERLRTGGGPALAFGAAP